MNNFQLKTPIVFLIFNRPNITEKVFAAIRQAKPPKLFVIADGPRSNRKGELEKCSATRAIIAQVDWDCEILTNYSDVNLGLKNRVSSGLDWVFHMAEEAIILEDDCLPHPTFFRFCEELLDYYRNDERVMVISGGNYQLGHRRNQYSYYFSRYAHPWGWASWRRAWKYYDADMNLWQEVYDSNLLQSIFEEPKEVNFWRRIFQDTYDNRIKTWDYQWIFSILIQNGLVVTPQVNLITNIGFSEEATHTRNPLTLLNQIPTQEMCFPLQHPPYVIRHAQADQFDYEFYFNRPLLKRLIFKALALVQDKQ